MPISFCLYTAAVLVIFSVLAGCKSDTPPRQPPPTVFVSQPLEREVTGWDSFTGRFEAVDTVEVRSRVAGYIDRVAFHDGDFVHKGDLLFVIDPRPYQAVVDQARGRLDEARSQLQLANLNPARADTLIASVTQPRLVLDAGLPARRAAVPEER